MLKNEYKERVQVILNRKSEKDVELIKFIKSHDNISGYIKSLIIKDKEEQEYVRTAQA